MSGEGTGKTMLGKVNRREFLRWGTLTAAGLALPGLTACGGGGSAAQDFPIRPVTVIVPWGTGGGSDQMVRTATRIAERISEVQFVVENMPGAAGITGLSTAMQRPADGYTLFESQIGVTAFQQLAGQTEYVLGEDLVPVANMQDVTSALFIRADDDRFNNFEELVSYAEEASEPLRVAAGSVGASYDSIMIASVMDEAGIEYEQLPYDVSSERYASLEGGGGVDVLFEQPGDVMQFLDSGSYKTILVYSDEPVEGLEDVPTLRDLGIDAPTFGFDRGFMYRSGTPERAISFMSDLMMRVCETEEWQEFAREQIVRGDCLNAEEYRELVTQRTETYTEFAESG